MGTLPVPIATRHSPPLPCSVYAQDHRTRHPARSRIHTISRQRVNPTSDGSPMGDADSQTNQEPHKQRRRSYDAAMNDRDVACGLKEAQQRSPSPPHGDRARYKARRRSTDAEEQEMPGRELGGLHAMTHGD